MNKRTQTIIEEAELLSAEERIEMIEKLLASLDRPDADIDRAWTDEAERRLDVYLDGSINARDAHTVLAKHLKP
jgi:putative addiction module component (TIGR02574 family)